MFVSCCMHFYGKQKTEGKQERTLRLSLILFRKTGQREAYRGSANVADDLTVFVIGCVGSYYFSAVLCLFTMPIRKDRPFKAPRLAKRQEETKDSDEDDRPIAQTLETTKTSVVHRKDHSELVKAPRLAKPKDDTKGSDGDDRPIAQTLEITKESGTDIKTGQTPLLDKRKSVFRRLNTALDKTEGSEDGAKQKREIGKTAARDFGEAGVFTGEIVEVEYDSEDVEKVEPIYVVLYTDGDREDMDADEMQYAHELHLRCLGVDMGNESKVSGSDEEEFYRPSSPKVSLIQLQAYIIALDFILTTPRLENRVKEKASSLL